MEKLGFVPQTYTMDPETEDLLPSGEMLREGMVVLIESWQWRYDIDRELTDRSFNLALQRNRWCTVTQIKRNELGNHFKFVGVYEDGTKRVREIPTGVAWLVKLDSIPPHITESGKYEAVFAILADVWNRSKNQPDMFVGGLTRKDTALILDSETSRIFRIFDQEA